MWPFKRKASGEQTGGAEDQWLVAQGFIGEQPIVAKFRQGVSAGAFDGQYDHVAIASVEVRSPTDAGMPHGAETAQLYDIEDMLVPALERGSRTVHVGTVTGCGRRDMYFYTAEPERIEELVNQAQRHVNSHALLCSVDPDPDWMTYGQFCTVDVAG